MWHLPFNEHARVWVNIDVLMDIFLFLLVKYRLTWNKHIRRIVQIIYGVFKLTGILINFPYLFGCDGFGELTRFPLM